MSNRFTTEQKDGFFIKPSFKKPPPTVRKNRKQSTATEVDNNSPQKKPFDKRKWRTQKYSIKNKLDHWKDKKNLHIMHEYRKQRNRGHLKLGEEGEGNKSDEHEPELKLPKNKREMKARREELKKQAEHKKRESIVKAKAEKEEALKKYKKKKIDQYKKLNQKTKRGQPVMKGRIEYLLEKIQNNINS